MHISCREGNIEVVIELLKKGANIEVTTKVHVNIEIFAFVRHFSPFCTPQNFFKRHFCHQWKFKNIFAISLPKQFLSGELGR